MQILFANAMCISLRYNRGSESNPKNNFLDRQNHSHPATKLQPGQERRGDVSLSEEEIDQT